MSMLLYEFIVFSTKVSLCMSVWVPLVRDDDKQQYQTICGYWVKHLEETCCNHDGLIAVYDIHLYGHVLVINHHVDNAFGDTHYV